jgi:hypothetical protein
MKLGKRKMSHRLQDLFGSGLHCVQDMADNFRDDASSMAKRARRRFDRRTTSEKMVDNVKDHPMIFTLAAITFVGLILLQLMFMSAREEPQLDEQEPFS